jgi:hypothetical protein
MTSPDQAPMRRTFLARIQADRPPHAEQRRAFAFSGPIW